MGATGMEALPTRRSVLGYDEHAPEPEQIDAVYFQSWHADDEEVDQDEGDEDDDGDEAGDDSWRGVQKRYIIRGFGSLPSGRGVTAVIRSFRPFFYVKCTCSHAQAQTPYAKQQTYDQVRRALTEKFKVEAIQLVPRIDFWGFHGGKEEPFLKVEFLAVSLRNWTAKQLMKAGYVRAGSMSVPIKLYESNLDPMLRFFHMANIPPVGWCRLEGVASAERTSAEPRMEVRCEWNQVHPLPDGEGQSRPVPPSIIASFDIESDSLHGDFPMAVKDYQSLAIDCEQVCSTAKFTKSREYDVKERLCLAILQAFGLEPAEPGVPVIGRRLRLKRMRPLSEDDIAYIRQQAKMAPDDLFVIFKAGDSEQMDRAIDLLNGMFGKRYPLAGDPVIQIGLTVTLHPSSSAFSMRNVIFTLGSCTDIDKPYTYVREFDSEATMLLEWAAFIRGLDPDYVVGYNIFGFDMAYLYDRAKETMGAMTCDTSFCRFGRLYDRPDKFIKKEMSSSALGENIFKLIDMPGRNCIDLMKVVQREHRLDSYKLDNVARIFLGDQKQDITPKDIFRLQKGTADDRRVIAEYCIQDCALCNHLMDKLKIIPNNAAMANVCCVPLSYIIMRGQGVKIFSLVARQCRLDNMVIPTLCHDEDAPEDEGYEGAIVLEPKVGMYLERPVSVLDYNSLYPSSMISHNLSHDTLVIDPKYDNLFNVAYHTVQYDNNVCRYVSNTHKKGVLPRILETLLQARKATRKRMQYKRVTLPDEGEGDTKVAIGLLNESEGVLTTELGERVQLTEAQVASAVLAHSPFEISVLDGLQLAYKVTANSLYGQMGARTSPLYLKHIAACTTAVGRQMILTAKDFVEKECGAKVVYGDSVTGYTPVLLCVAGLGIVVRPIEDIFSFGTSTEWSFCEGEGQGKEYVSFRPGSVYAWTEDSWTELKCVIRHKLAPGKSLKHVQTDHGFVHVTDDHSLVCFDNTPLSTKDLSAGTMLMHCNLPVPGLMANESVKVYQRMSVDASAYEIGLMYRKHLTAHNGAIPVPDEVLNHPDVMYRIGFLMALCDPGMDNMITIPFGNVSVQTPAASIVVLAYGCGYSVKLNWIEQSPYLSIQLSEIDDLEISASYGSRIRVMCDVMVCQLGLEDNVPITDQYVYDLTTANHHFQAGIGSMIVHNTDSIFLVFDKATSDTNGHYEALSLSIREGQHASKAIKPLLPYPHNLEYEKTLFPLILLSKKRYVGLLYEDDPDAKPKQKSMGIALKRRDYAPIVKRVYGGVIDIILNDRDIPKATRFLVEELSKLAKNDYDVADLIISKTLKSFYKLPHTIAHAVLARRMAARDPGSAPQVNDRIPYVFVKNSDKNALMGERIEHIDYVMQHNPVNMIDTKAYIERQIMKPCLQLLAIALESIAGYVPSPELCLPDHDAGRALIALGKKQYHGDLSKARVRLDTLREREVQRLLFDPVLSSPVYTRQPKITSFFGK